MNPKLHNESRLVLVALASLMALTRFSHEGTAFALPDASLAVFFLAGFYLNAFRQFALLLVLAFMVDYAAIAGFGVSDYCVSPAYVFLVPTYGIMWLAGRWLARQSRQSGAAYGAMLAAALGVSASLAFLISNGSFFWFSGKISSLDIVDYALGLSGQYLPYVGAAAGYAALGLGIASLLCALADARLGRAGIR
jgi:hypothetical protein